MPDDLTKRGGLDRELIALKQKHEVAYWTKRFGVSKAELAGAVKAVGHGRDAVYQALKQRPTILVRTVKNRTLNWKPDLPDFRDHVYSPSVHLVVPSILDLSQFVDEIEDQGSFTGTAITSSVKLFLNKRGVGGVSRLFIQYNEGTATYAVHEDSGAYIRDGIKALVKYGWCSEKMWPSITVKNFSKKPPPSAYKEAAKRCIEIEEYARVTSLVDLKAAIAEGFPVVFGFSAFDSFMTQEVARAGLVGMPTSDAKLLGGHVVLAIGYNDETQLVKCQNSWGELWGDKGLFYLPYEFVGNTRSAYADDFWVLRLKS